MSITLLKKEALQLLKKNWSISIICFFFFHSIIIFLILSLESFFDLFRIDISSFSLIILLIFMFSLHPVFYIISYFTYINKKWSLEYIFKNINIFFKLLNGFVISFTLIILWSLLFVIPGIIKFLSYSQILFILLENPNFTYKEAIKKSAELMRHNRLNYLKFILSFIVWGFLSCITLGGGFILLIPYFFLSSVAFYKKINNSQ